ncbi:hypothetical protein V502_05291 [Pseudogymnoascus sp. VKM F-4520 (FW-2644)]|nr:hypothetical protein V502_05291 [Pseudogymnoascus sp. VKM F-4520 (FW-2644)]
MASVTNPFFAFLFPTEEKLLPWNYQTTNDWVSDANGIRNNPFFRTQFVQCSYPISGGYAPTLRYIFYVLAIASVVARKTSWAVTATLAHNSSQDGSEVHDNYEVVLVEGTSTWGSWESATQNGPVWLPLLPMVWDTDCDPVLAIVGSAFLLLLPIQIWSRTFRGANRTQRAIIYGWALVLLVGLISALINRAYVDLWSFPQFRFCPIDQEDKLPFSNSGSDTIAGPWDKHDRWPLRDPEDIFVLIGSYGATSETNTTYSLLVAVLYSNHIPAEWRDLQLVSVRQKTREAFGDVMSKPSVISSYGILALRLWILCITFYASVLSGFALAFMVGYTEWGMWVSDPGGETFKHIGQWGALVAAILVIGAALILGITSPTTTVKTDHDLSEDQTSGNGLRMDNLPSIPAHPAPAP